MLISLNVLPQRHRPFSSFSFLIPSSSIFGPRQPTPSYRFPSAVCAGKIVSNAWFSRKSDAGIRLMDGYIFFFFRLVIFLLIFAKQCYQMFFNIIKNSFGMICAGGIWKVDCFIRCRIFISINKSWTFVRIEGLIIKCIAEKD